MENMSYTGMELFGIKKAEVDSPIVVSEYLNEKNYGCMY